MELHKKTFSTANLAVIVPAFLLLLRLACFGLNSVKSLPFVLGPLAFISIVSFLVFLYIKFPLFVDRENIDFENFKHTYSKKTGWLICLYYSLFTVEPSKFISLFSSKNLRFYKNERNCSFKWEYKKPKVIHRILDIMLMISLVYISSIILKILYSWSDIKNINFYFLLFIVAVMMVFKRIILSYGLSVTVEKSYGCNVNVIYPYSTSNLSLMKQFGQAMPFIKTIMITQDVFYGNSIIKKYIVAHEVGHTRDNIRTFFIIGGSILSMAFLVFSPFWLANNGFMWLVFLPFILYLLYSMTLGYKIREKSEFFADAYAVKLIGKEQCLTALNLIKSQNINNKKSNAAFNMFFKIVPIERKIEFINEYQDKN